MVGQIYKDFRVSVIPLAAIGFLVVFNILLIVSALNDAAVSGSELTGIAAFGLFVMNLVVPILAMYTVQDADEKEKWPMYAMTLPGGASAYVKSKYVFIVIMMLISAAVTYLYICILDGFWGDGTLISMNCYLIMLADGIGMLLSAFHFPFVFRFGMKAGNLAGGVLIAAMLLAFYIFVMFGNLSLMEDGDIERKLLEWAGSHGENIMLVILSVFFLGILAMVLSCRFSVWLFRKGGIIRESI